MKSKFYYILVTLTLLLGSCFVYFRGHIDRLVHPNNYYLACTDYGQYYIEIKDYLAENTYYLDIIRVGEDPGFFIVASNLLRITNIPSQNILTLLSMFMYCMVGLCLYVLCSKKINQSGNKYLAGVIAVFLYISLYGTVESNISGIWRQIIGMLFFLVFLLSKIYPNSKSYIFVSILMGAMMVLTHRIFMIILFFIFGFTLIKSFFQGKKERNKNIYFLIAIILLCLPYLLLLYEYVIHVLEYKESINLAGAPTRGDFVLQQSEKNLGWSFFGPRDSRTAILHYLFYQSYIFIAGVAFFIGIYKKFNKVYIFSFIFLLFYVLDRFDFSVRVLLIFEIVMIPIIAFNFIFNYSKHVKIILIVGIFLLGMLPLSKSLLIRRPAAREYDEGVLFLINNIDTNKKHFFLSSVCGADLLAQLNITNLFNFQMQLHGMKEKKAMNIPDVYELQGLIQSSIVFLKREGLLFNYFEDKGSLFIIFLASDKQEVGLIQSGKSDLLGKEYLQLVYPKTTSKPGAGIVKYVFQIDTSKIRYTDTKAYIQANVKNLNLMLDF